MRREERNILFVFLSFQHRESTNRVAVLHSLIFQLLYQHHYLRPALQKAFDSDFRDLQSFADYNQQLLTDLLQCIGVTYLVIDGLDEITEKERPVLLQGFLQMSNLCPELKVMISSRDETDISGLLRTRALSLRIGLRNSEGRHCLERLLSIPDFEGANYPFPHYICCKLSSTLFVSLESSCIIRHTDSDMC